MSQESENVTRKKFVFCYLIYIFSGKRKSLKCLAGRKTQESEESEKIFELNEKA